MSEGVKVSRRRFLKKTGLVAGAAAWTARSYAQVPGANDRLHVGLIGCGNIGSHHVEELLTIYEEENIRFTACCDVYRTRAARAQQKIKEAGAGEPIVTQDYREVLARDDVDYVIIATPEHSHAYLTLDALAAGKHVYCEKPMTHEIPEAFEVVKRARETGLKLQVGVQGMADDSYASAFNAIQSGKLGPVIEAQIDYVRNYPKDQGPWRVGVKSDLPKPDDLDWAAWVRPARKRPWNPHHYFEWRCYRDYSGGIATDLFVHRITRLLKACGLSFPVRAVGMGGIYLWPDGRDLPDNFEMMLEYPAVDGVTPGMTVHVLGTMANERGNPHCIRGHDGTLTFTPKGWEIREERTGKIILTHEKTGGEDVKPHHKNHHDAIRSNAPLNCPPELGLYAVVAVRMANESWFRRRMVEWDSRRNKVVNA